MNARLLKDSVNMLKELRSELRDSMEDSVLQRLDDIIQNLEAHSQTPEKIDVQDMLNFLGSILEKLPVIVELIHLIINSK